MTSYTQQKGRDYKVINISPFVTSYETNDKYHEIISQTMIARFICSISCCVFHTVYEKNGKYHEIYSYYVRN